MSCTFAKDLAHNLIYCKNDQKEYSATQKLKKKV